MVNISWLLVHLICICPITALIPWSIPKIPSRLNITVPDLKSTFLSLKGAFGEYRAYPKASKLSGKWKKIEEVGQDQAMQQVVIIIYISISSSDTLCLKLGLNIIYRRAAGLLRFVHGFGNVDFC